MIQEKNSKDKRQILFVESDSREMDELKTNEEIIKKTLMKMAFENRNRDRDEWRRLLLRLTLQSAVDFRRNASFTGACSSSASATPPALQIHSKQN
jgi:hypothetical protein